MNLLFAISIEKIKFINMIKLYEVVSMDTKIGQHVYMYNLEIYRTRRDKLIKKCIKKMNKICLYLKKKIGIMALETIF